MPLHVLPRPSPWRRREIAGEDRRRSGGAKPGAGGATLWFFWSAAVLATEMDKNPGVHLENVAEQGNYRWFKDVQ